MFPPHAANRLHFAERETSMSTKKSSKPKQQKSKKGAKPPAKPAPDQDQVKPAEAMQTDATPAVAPAAETTATVEQSTAEVAQAETPPSTTLVWPEQPITQETDVATYYMWITSCGRYRVYLMMAKLNGQSG